MARESSLSKTSKESVQEIQTKIENDYRLGPLKKFRLSEVNEILKAKTDAAFEGIVEYNFDDMSTIAKFLSADLLSACNDLKWPAFKIVASVKIMELCSQTARGSLRYYWNAMDDGLAYYIYESVNYRAFVTVAFFYYE